MEDFTRVDIYDTKGIEYLFVIAYLVILILVWTLFKKPIKVMEKVRNAFGTLSGGILRIPQGVFFSKQHTWTHLSESGEAKVGLNDFLPRVTGNVGIAWSKEPGHPIRKGDLLAEIFRDGKHLKIYSPISGQILNNNHELQENPEAFQEDPYGSGWLYKIKPSDWMEETRSFLLAEKASQWASNEIDRFKEFLTRRPVKSRGPEPSPLLLQDGGEIRENVLADLPAEAWEAFQQEFLDIKE